MKFSLFRLLLVLVCSAPWANAQSPSAVDAHPLYLDPAQPIAARVEDLLQRLTPEEKDSLIHASATFATPPIERLGIPERWMSDGPNGVREEIQRNTFSDLYPLSNLIDASTAFPSGICLAATWNPELAKIAGQAIGEEARARGKDIILGPAVNIERTPLNGRSFEYLGEDPWLSGRIAVGFIQGEQSRDVASSVKHFAANNQETQRNSINVNVDERTLREIYLPAFEAAVKEGGALTVMAAYNKINGSFCAEDDYLLNQILKKEWGFKGLVMTDWGASHTTAGSATNGLDLEMGTRVNINVNYQTDYHLAQPFLAGVQDGTYPMALLDDKVRRNLYVMFATHVFDPGRITGSINIPEHQATSRTVAEEGMVLLKNDNHALPLDLTQIKSIAIIGDNAQHLQAFGGESSGIKAAYEVSPLQGITKRMGPNIQITYAQGYVTPAAPVAGRLPPSDMDKLNAAMRKTLATDADAATVLQQHPDFQLLAGGTTPAARALIAEAVQAAKQADIAIVISGLNKNYDTEGSDRPDLFLPGDQDELIDEVVAANPRTIVVLVSGSPVAMGPWLQKVPALLQAWYGGSEAGNALARILLGDVNPSGKLPCTFPKQLSDTPAAAGGAETYPGVNGQVYYSEGLLVGYRWYDTKNIAPLFPFGYGLSYTTFQYSNLKITPGDPASGVLATAQFEITNTGTRDGAEVAQLYIHQDKPTLERPEKELKGFQKIALKAGETKMVSIPLAQRAFAYYDPAKPGWVAEAGSFQIEVSSSSRDIRLKDTFNLTQSSVTK
ncbi:MAG TPA: glycoside hydrolase family 3 C-terminal domain-containing protein [Opitutales bacterium]|jgi:beta-glucosidase|nr:glycoside hydrolase family 3 C-terminal domain-containing protein [Opitutales bacterium]